MLPRVTTAEDQDGAESVIAPQSVVDQVAESILGLILSNALEPGQPVAIQELSAQLGVSHVPVREALRRLEGRGLVLFRRGRRPQISPLSVNDFDQIYHLRALIEGDVARRSADLMTPEAVARLEQALVEFERILTRGNAMDVYTVHSQFHALLLPGANRWDRRVLDELWTASERYIQLYVGFRPDPTPVQTILAAHRRLLDAAASGGEDGLPAAIVKHVEESRTLMSSAVQAASGSRRE